MPYGPSPHGGNWGNTPWEDAFQLPGSFQVGCARHLLERYPWWRFEPHQEWVEPSGSSEDVNAPFVAGIPAMVRVVYFYGPTMPWAANRTAIVAIEPKIEYRSFFWDPRCGDVHDLGKVVPDTDGRWQIPLQPTFDDWVLVLDATEACLSLFDG